MISGIGNCKISVKRTQKI